MVLGKRLYWNSLAYVGGPGLTIGMTLHKDQRLVVPQRRNRGIKTRFPYLCVILFINFFVM